MNSDTTAQIISAVIGVVVITLYRLIDRFLPDPEGKHPLPPPPGEQRPPDATILPVDPPRS